jgi:hydrogenase-4 component B
VGLLEFALLLYVVGTITVLFPKSKQLVAHYVAQSCSIVASGIVFFVSLAQFEIFSLSNFIKMEVLSSLFTLTKFNSFFLAIIGLAGFITSIYALSYAKNYLGKRIRILSGLWSLFLLSMICVLVAENAISFLFAWEIMAVVSFLFVNHESEKKGIWQAAYQYFVMTYLGTGAITIAFVIMGSAANSIYFSDMAKVAINGTARNWAFITAFFGFALKSGLVPLHVWLPNAHPVAPSHVSALMSGVMLKVAVYGFLLVLMILGHFELWWGILVLMIGLISGVLGSLYALMGKDIKKILAYSSVENMGIVFTGIGVFMILLATGHITLASIGFIAALVHTFNHSVMKTLMFMSAGSIMHSVGSKNIEEMGGIIKYMPKTAAFTLIGAMSLAALPLTSGFVGEWLTIQSFIALLKTVEASEYRLLVAFSLLLFGLTGAAALGCFVRYFGIIFLGKARSNLVRNAHESSKYELCAFAISAFLIIFTGIQTNFVVNSVKEIITDNNFMKLPIYVENSSIAINIAGAPIVYDPMHIIFFLAISFIMLLTAFKLFGGKIIIQKKNLTWNCGSIPTTRQQYSATGFSKPLRRTFGFLLKPQRKRLFLERHHKYFGRRLKYNLLIPDLFTEKLYYPIQKYTIVGSRFLRRIQIGNVQLYVGYVMVAMVLVLIWGAM